MNLNLNTSATCFEEGGWVKSWLTCWMIQSQCLSLTLLCFLGFSIPVWVGVLPEHMLVGWGQGAPLDGLPACLMGHMIVGLVPCLGVPWCCSGDFTSLPFPGHLPCFVHAGPSARSPLLLSPIINWPGFCCPPPPTARNNNGVNLILCPSLHLWYTSNLRQSSSFEQSDFIWYCFQKTKLDLTSQMTLYNSQAFKGIFRSANIWQQWKFSFQTAENNRHAEFSTIPSLERNNSLQGKPQEQKTGFF